MGNLAGWPYWKVVSITGQAGAGTDYQTKITIGDSVGGDFHLEGHCTNFPQDIRITDDDGTTLLDHHVLDLTADPIVVYVEVKDDLGSNQDIRVYYGKSGETTASNGTNTYLSFFDGDSSGWTEVDPNSHISFANNRLEWAGLARNENAYVYQSVTIPDEYIIEHMFRDTAASAAGAEVYSGIVTDTLGGRTDWVNAHTHMSYWGGVYEGCLIRISSSEYYDLSTVTDNVIYHSTITRVGNTFTEKLYTDSARTSLAYTHTVTQAGMPSLDYVMLVASKNDADTKTITGWMDDFRVRKYNSPEPAFSSAGAEQSAAGVPTGVFYGPLVGPFGGPI